VLVRVRAASVHPDVWHVVTGRPYVLRLMGAGLFKPKNPVPGTDVAGHVESVGENVTQFRPGDDVFGESLKGALQWMNGSAFAEYASVSQDALALKPQGISFKQAAAVPTSGLIALLNLQNQRKIKPGQSVVINGAAGGVGSIAVQLAKAYGARVTGVDGTKKLEMVRALGADHVIDYTQEDFTQLSERYDLIFDVASNLSLSDCKRALTPKGIYVFVNHLPGQFVSAPRKKDSMAVLKELLEAGKLTPIVDRTFPLSAVPEALTYLQSGNARGKIIITP